MYSSHSTNMAKYLGISATSVVLFCIICLLISSNEGKGGMVVMAEGKKICGRLSKTWSGWCGDTTHCDNQCRKWEGAQHGACHARFPGRACFCYFHC